MAVAAWEIQTWIQPFEIEIAQPTAFAANPWDPLLATIFQTSQDELLSSKHIPSRGVDRPEVRRETKVMYE